MQQEITVLRRIPIVSLGEIQDCIVCPLNNQLARIAISADTGRMTQAGENAGLMDIKKNLRQLYEMTAIGVMDNKEMAREIKSLGETVSYTSLQISNHDARIDDNKSTLREMLGKVDRIQEDLERLITMNQGGRVNEATTEADHQMEEESVVQPRDIRGNP